MTGNRIKCRNVCLIVAATLTLASAGCQSFERTPTVFSRIGSGFNADEKVEYEQPHRMAAIWKETAMPARSGRTATRGFGGRFYFYNAGNDPVRVDGELLVYAFDDTQSDPDQPGRVPDRKYVFRAAELQQHYSCSEIGPSYSFWIPWDAVGGPTCTVTLLPVFKPVDGAVVQAGQSITVLPGKKAASEFNKVEMQTASVGVRKAAAWTPAAPNAAGVDAAARLPVRRDTTINVPRTMSNHLKQATRNRPDETRPAAQFRRVPRQPSEAVRGAAGLPSRATAPLGDSATPWPAGDAAATIETEPDPLLDRLRAEHLETMDTGQEKRPVVFGRPGPWR